jgi:hypothetical protein
MIRRCESIVRTHGDPGRGRIMSRTPFRIPLIAAVLLGVSGIAAGEETKEPSAKAKEAAKLLKDNVAKFSLSVRGLTGKEQPIIVLVTDKELAKKAPKVTFVISEDEARAVIDGLVTAGQFDKPLYIPPPGFPAPGWYLYVGLAETPPRVYQWFLGNEKYDLTTDAAVSEIIKSLEGDAKKALQALAKSTAK